MGGATVSFEWAYPAVYFERPARLYKLVELMAPTFRVPDDVPYARYADAKEDLTPRFGRKSLKEVVDLVHIGGQDCIGTCTYTRAAAPPQCDLTELLIESVAFEVVISKGGNYENEEERALADLIVTVVAEFGGEIGLAAEKLRPEEERELPGSLRCVDGEDRCDLEFFSAWRKRPTSKLFY